MLPLNLNSFSCMKSVVISKYDYLFELNLRVNIYIELYYLSLEAGMASSWMILMD